MKISNYNSFINEGNLLDHLKSRGLDTEKTHVLYDEESGNTYFFLYNLSGQMIGYQKYNPEGVKKDYGEEARYYTFLGKEYDKLDNANRSKISVYGLETYDVHKKYIFVVEGIWDVIKLHNAHNKKMKDYDIRADAGYHCEKDIMKILYNHMKEIQLLLK